MRKGIVILLSVLFVIIDQVQCIKYDLGDYPNLLMWAQAQFSWLNPNHGDDHGNPHAIRRGHWTAEAFKLSAKEIAVKNNFIFESYNATTRDGFILEVFRIRNPSFINKSSQPQPVVFLQHGIMDNADCWMVTHADEAPAFVLANEGYDVWLGNTRGTKYSRRHKKYSPDGPTKAKFWNFSWQEMGRYDVPAQISVVKRITKVDKVTYIGHSMGSTQMFFALSHSNALREYLHDSVNLFISFAPVTQVSHTTAPVLKLGQWFQGLLWWASNTFQWYEWFGEVDQDLVKFFCAVANPICVQEFKLFNTKNPVYEDANRMQVYLAHSFQSVSVRTLYHFAQNAKEGVFRQFDFGSEELNKKHYKQAKAPLVDLSSVRLAGVPIAMFTFDGDILLTPTDAEWTRDQISGYSDKLGRNVVVHYEQLAHGGHDSYFVSNDMSFLNKVIDLVKQYNPRPLTEREKAIHYISGEDPYEKDLDKIYEKYVDSPQ